VIEPAASPWCSNVVMVRKQDGTMRLCVDYRKLNCLTVKDKFPLPKIDTCLDTLNGCEFFSTCDLRWGYWQTEIDERDRDKTAFVTRKGQWRFKVLSFGLANAPSQFARIMELVMSGLTYDVCLVYLDDILVFLKTFDEHLVRLATVFNRLDHYGLKLKPSKCSLFQCKVSFLDTFKRSWYYGNWGGHRKSGLPYLPDRIFRLSRHQCACVASRGKS